MRTKIWKFVTRKQPEGAVLPGWLLIVRYVLYPADTFYWRMSKTRGYQPLTDTWNIHGVLYTETALRNLAEAQGEVYRITAANKRRR